MFQLFIILGAAKLEHYNALCLSIYLSISFGVCVSAVCGLRVTDLRRVAFSCKQRFQFISIAPDKATKQLGDLSVFMFYSMLIIDNTSRSYKTLAER